MYFWHNGLSQFSIKHGAPLLTFTPKERLLARLNIFPVPIHDVFVAPLLGHVLATAIRLNIFENLAEPRSPEELAGISNIHSKASILLLSYLSASGYVKKIDGRFALKPAAKKWLLKNSEHYIGNFVRYVELLYSHWLYLEETLGSGKPPAKYTETFGEEQWKIYVYGMMDLARITFPHIATKMRLPDNAENFLDLAGSHGYYSIKLCQHYPGLRATILDLPPALHFAQRILKEHRGADRVSLEPGNILENSAFANKQDLFDAALAANIVHGLTPDENRLFLANASFSIKRGGLLYILDQFINKAGSNLEQFVPLSVGINLMNEVGGSVYTLDELREWCGEAGFPNLRVYRLRLPGVFLIRLKKT